MENVINIVKQHPVPIGIGVVVILLLVMSRGSAASSGSNAGAYLQSQEIAANSNNQMAALNSQNSIALGAQSVDRYNIAEKAATDRTGIVASLFSTLAGVNAQVTMANSNNTVKTVQTTIAHQENMQTIANNLTAQQGVIAANVKINGDKLSAAQNMLESDNNFKLAYLGPATESQIKLLDASSKNLPYLLQHAEVMAQISGNNALSLANANNQARNTEAAANARATNASTSQSWLGSVGSIISSLF